MSFDAPLGTSFWQAFGLHTKHSISSLSDSFDWNVKLCLGYVPIVNMAIGILRLYELSQNVNRSTGFRTACVTRSLCECLQLTILFLIPDIIASIVHYLHKPDPSYIPSVYDYESV